MSRLLKKVLPLLVMGECPHGKVAGAIKPFEMLLFICVQLGNFAQDCLLSHR